MNDPTKTEPGVIELAYNTVCVLPSQESFRRGDRKKNENPAHTAPTLNRVITHLNVDENLAWAREKARALVLSKEAGAHINTLRSTPELKDFLATLSLFLRTTATKDRKPMKTYKEHSSKTLAPEQVIERAWSIAQEISWQAEWVANKLIRMTGRIRSAQSKWECLAVLAQYFPLKGIPQALIDKLVEQLGELDLASFQALVSQIMVFYNAASVTPKQSRKA